MVRFVNVLNNCDMRNVLRLMTEGLPGTKYWKMMIRYYSLYCWIKGRWISKDCTAVIITGFKERKKDCGQPVYGLYGILDDFGMRKNEEFLLDINTIFENGAEVLLPECILDKISDEWIVAEILIQLEKSWDEDTHFRADDKLLRIMDGPFEEKENKMDSIELIMEYMVNHKIDSRVFDNEIEEYEECKAPTYKWKNLLDQGSEYLVDEANTSEAKKIFLTRAILQDRVPKDGVPGFYKRFLVLDYNNPPDIIRCYNRKKRLEMEYEELTLSMFQEIRERHKRIIVEKNSACGKFPCIYVKDKNGRKTDIREEAICELLCMDIHVMDSHVVDKEQLLALILFYLEYPLRVKRVQTTQMREVLIEMFQDWAQYKKGVSQC